MWIASKYGFYSIVQKPAPMGEPRFHVRGRTAEDLNRLVEAAGLDRGARPVQVEFWPGADYKFRIRVGEGQLVEVLLALGHSITYDNFKAMIAKAKDQGPKLPAYEALWYDLLLALDINSERDWDTADGDEEKLEPGADR